MAQVKQNLILYAHFSRQAKLREFALNIKYVFLHREFTFNTGKVLKT